jgi:nucleoside-diphosphate-sugar epimerase
VGGDGMIYVIGKNGYIASNLIPYMQSRGHEVEGINHEEVYAHSIFDRYGWADDIAINCAAYGAIPGQDYIDDMVEANFGLPRMILHYNWNVKLIQLSSSSEIFQPYTAYARTKSLASDYLRGKATLCYIYTAYGGINQHEHMFMTQLLKAKKEGKMFQVETPYATRDFIHIKRICEGIEKLIHEPIQEVHFGHGKARRMFSVAKKVMDYKYEWSGGQPDQPEWKAANPYFTDTFEEDLQEEICAL